MIPKLPKGFTHPMEIGGGAFARVYRARQKTLDRWVAIKVIHERDRAKRSDLLREARTQAGLHIACIPQVYDAFVWGGRVCIVMQWIKGVSLATVLEQPLTPEQRSALAWGIVASLAELHAEGYAHRDLKPANIVVSPSDGVSLIDFGFTKNVMDGEQSMAGVVKGTPAYMAPELWSGEPEIDYRRADLYALGKVLRLVLGDHPSVGSTDGLLEEDPVCRPVSAVEVAARWSAAGAPLVSSRLWEEIAGRKVAETLAPRLLAAVRQLLYAGREDEAYWMLVECLEEDPDMPEALELLGSFPAKTGRGARGWRVPLAVVVGCVAVLLAGAFAAGRRTSRHELVVRVAGDRTSPTTKMSALSRAEVGGGGSDATFLGDTLRVDALAGRLLLVQRPQEGTLLVDDQPAAAGWEKDGGLSLSYGRHALAWRGRQGRIVWRERVTVLPFQTKGIRVELR